MNFENSAFEALEQDPGRTIEGALNGTRYSARILIPHYGERIAEHYQITAPQGLAAACAQSKLPFDLSAFGLSIVFEQEFPLAVHDEDWTLNESVRALVQKFGPVLFQNAFVDGKVRKDFHRNIFPHLRFHVDRGLDMPNQMSCFTRDPSDPEQRRPRTSSTLFIANIVAWLELKKNGIEESDTKRGLAKCDLYGGIDAEPLFGNIVLEQRWDAPEGVGEIAVIDNRTVLHATFNRIYSEPSYRIGARYLY